MVDWSGDPFFLHSALRHLVYSDFHVSLQILIVHSTLAGLRKSGPRVRNFFCCVVNATSQYTVINLTSCGSVVTVPGGVRNH